MRHSIWFAGLASLALLLVMSVQPASAQATRTWVSGVGDDANPCSRTAPCKTFAGAISKTAAGGEISVLDPGGFGAVTITKSISITNNKTGEAGILSSSTTGIIVNAAATDTIKIHGIVIDGAPPGSPGLNGIRFIAGGALHVEDCVIKNYPGSANAIAFAPSSGNAELYVSDTTITETGGGILIQPTGSGTANASINRVQMENNTQGARADTTQTTGNVSLTISNSVASGNSSVGVSAASKLAGATSTNVMLNKVVMSFNGTGVIANGPGVTVLIGSSVLNSNGTAVTISNSGVVQSYKNNQIDLNGNNSTPIPQVNLN